MARYQATIAAIIFLSIITGLIFWELKHRDSLKSNTNEIEFWQYWSGEEKKPIEDLVAKFNSEDHKFKVKLLTISMPRKKILTAVAAKVAPDLVHLDGDMVSDFGLRNAIIELDPLITINKEEFIPIYLEMLNINGKQFAMPLMPNAEALHFNETLAKNYSINKPQTLDDLVNNFDKVGLVSWFPSWPPWAGQFIPIVFGGHWGIKDPNGQWRITANDPQNIQAWTWVQKNFARKISKEQIALFTEGNQSYQSPDNPFYASKIICENNGVWEKNLAQIYSPGNKISVSYFPGLVDKATQVSVDALAIPVSAKHPQEASEFMLWLLKQENLEYLALAQHKFTPRRKHSQDFFAKHPNPYINIFIDLASSPNAQYFPQVKFSSRYKRAIRNAYNQMLRLESSPEKALNKLQKEFS